MRKHLSFRKGMAAAVVFLLVTLICAGQVMAYPVSDYASVANTRQQNSMWCWAASSVSVLNYFGINVSQSSFVTTVKGSPINEGGWNYESQYGMSYYGVNSTETGTLSYNTIMSEISTYNRPIYFDWQWTSGGGHAMVLDGYYNYSSSSQYVYYMDPWYAAHYSKVYRKFVSDYDHYWNGSLYHMYR